MAEQAEQVSTSGVVDTKAAEASTIFQSAEAPDGGGDAGARSLGVDRGAASRCEPATNCSDGGGSCCRRRRWKAAQWCQSKSSRMSIGRGGRIAARREDRAKRRQPFLEGPQHPRRFRSPSRGRSTRMPATPLMRPEIEDGVLAATLKRFARSISSNLHRRDSFTPDRLREEYQHVAHAGFRL